MSVQDYIVLKNDSQVCITVQKLNNLQRDHW